MPNVLNSGSLNLLEPPGPVMGLLYLDSISYVKDEVLHKSNSLYPDSTVFCGLLDLLTIYRVFQKELYNFESL